MTDVANIENDAAFPGDDSGTYRSGSAYTCCGAGRGVTCCTADAGLLGYEVQPDGAIMPVGDLRAGPEANCFQYGGVVGKCAGEGVTFDGKDACVLCCQGLVRVNEFILSDASPDACVPVLSIFACLPCGNGICDPEENPCTCPADCPRP